MISVMNDFEIDRKPKSDTDLSFFGMESPTKEEDEGSDPMEADESHPPLDLMVEPEGIEEEEGRRVSPPALRLPVLPPGSPPSSVKANGLVTGDMVWGKVKSHPWWPGHIFNESFASPLVRRTKRDGFVLVAFFGDSSYGWFDLSELIPYEPNFPEKLKQTTSRNFVRAVEESVDEVSRRAALGISCRCRNPFNFRPTRVPEYFEVDVVGYERNGIYSKRQIDRERRSFESSDAIGFLKQLAMTPKEEKKKDVEWYRNVALVLALRRHMYAEFDPTYAQAFGLQPIEPARDEKGVREQAESFAPRVAPLSGPLVFAETLGIKKKSFNKLSGSISKSSSSSHSKKNKYLLKRRDNHPAAAAGSSPSLPDPYFAQKQQQAAPPFVLADHPADSSASSYVLQKRELAVVPQTPPLPVLDFDERPAAVDSVGVKKKEKKLKKRSLDDVNSREEAKSKKKKKGEGFGQDFPLLSKKLAEAAAESPVAPPPPRFVVPLLPDVDLGPLDQIDMPAVLGDLRTLALDPFYGVEHEVPLKVLHLILKFRAQFYSKSLPAEGDAQGQGQEAQPSKPSAQGQGQEAQPSKPPAAAAAAASSIVPPPSKKEPKEQQPPQREQASSLLKPAKLLKRTDDPTKSGRKRAPSDRQEEMLEKRSKKVNQVKSLASEKKVALTQKTLSDGPKGNNGGTAAAMTAAAMAAGPSAAEPARRSEKQELEPLLPPPPPSGNPTYLIMKFPPNSTLPSVANLKARFARFGSLEVDSIRVFWKSHSCRVLFKHKTDAVRARYHVESNDIFGPKVDYSIREVEAPAPEPQPEPPRRRLEPQGDGSLQLRSGNGSGNSSGVQSTGRLKSILKKPGDDAGKENQRVKFMLSSNGDAVSSSSSSKRSSPPPSSSSVGSSVSLPLLHPRQNLPQPSPARSYEPHQPSLPLPPARSYEPRPQLQMPLLMPPPFRSTESRAPVPPVHRPPVQQQQQNLNIDISHQMLSLLMRCSDIVSSLRSLPGFVPYRPL